MLGLCSNNIYTNYNAPITASKVGQKPNVSTHTNYATPSFTGKTVSAPQNNISMRTSLSTKEEKKQYKYLTKMLDKESRKALEMLLKSGKLLNNNANDKTTALDNLYKMATTPRAEGINAPLLISNTINTIANPFTITQTFGDIPKEEKQKFIDKLTNNSTDLIERGLKSSELDELYSGCCPAASEEFNLATTNPAEFARFAEGLTSPSMSVTKTIKLSSLSNKTLDAIMLLDAFEIPYKTDNFNTTTITLAPDKNAIVREQLQEKYKDPLERTPLDVLMQSTFMNVGSEQDYNTLNDKRGGKFSMDDKGLVESEKTFVESVVEDKNITSVIYQTVDENNNITGYETDYKTVESQLLETLDSGHNIIIGYTMTDENKHIIGGHEITIIGHNVDKNGELSFICNDTDDDLSAPIEYPASYLIPKIHHAGIPTEIAEKTMKETELWVYGVDEFNKNNQSKSYCNIDTTSTAA